jgi:hypothetical protein
MVTATVACMSSRTQLLAIRGTQGALLFHLASFRKPIRKIDHVLVHEIIDVVHAEDSAFVEALHLRTPRVEGGVRDTQERSRMYELEEGRKRHGPFRRAFIRHHDIDPVNLSRRPISKRPRLTAHTARRIDDADPAAIEHPRSCCYGRCCAAAATTRSIFNVCRWVRTAFILDDFAADRAAMRMVMRARTSTMKFKVCRPALAVRIVVW